MLIRVRKKGNIILSTKGKPSSSEDKLSYDDKHRPPQFRQTLGRIALFVATFTIAQLTWQWLHGSAVEYAVIHFATVKPAAFIINILSPNIDASAVDFSVRATGGGINVLNGCEGMEVLLLLAAAFIVAPLSIQSRLVGFFIGVPVVFLVNQARILALFYAFRFDHSLFYSLHATIAPIIVIMCVTTYFYFWLTKNRYRIAKAS